MAKDVRVSRQTLSNKLKGDSPFTTEEAKRAAASLDAPVEEFLREEDRVVIRDSFHHRKGNGVVLHRGLPEVERELYERMLREKDEEIRFLREQLAQAKKA